MCYRASTKGTRIDTTYVLSEQIYLLVIILLVLLIRFLISRLMYLVSFLFSYKEKNKNKITPFECGFAPVGLIHRTFSIHFFIILIIFIIFDLEVILLLGVVRRMSDSIPSFLTLITFILGGLYFEWYLGKLRWVI